ncbi:hypothetical protein F0562_032693 [Nyssa sinensis]|uniref:BRO1 domain-containing protein n=1 Tax=Nyssa sinensis TaxID=561372 RepID=A0A5J5APY6_9ASTE|nr:hypothetical protein F0562_032693 [Nyssa sinensis]
MRSNLECTTANSLPACCDLLQSYYKALCTVEPQSPISLDKDHINSVTFTRYNLELHEKEEIAKEIARLKSGIGALYEAKQSSSKGAAQQLLDAINKLETNLNCNLERAVKENDRVYLTRVPPASSLLPLPAFSMVKSLSMNEVLDASKEKMFASLVPDSSAKALSKYTETLDDIIRTQAEKLQQRSELAQVRLNEMDLPDSILALEGNFTLATALKKDVEAVNICGGPTGLEAEL